jgi:hypothetical protein
MTGRLTMGHEVDSSAIIRTPGCCEVERLVQLADQFDGLQILPPAVFVRTQRPASRL